MRGIKRCTIVWLPKFKTSSLKWNIRQWLSLISIFPMLITRIFSSHLNWLLILILSWQSLESSVKQYMSRIKQCTIIWLPILKISSFKCNIRQCLSKIFIFPRLLPRRFSSQLIWILILILSRESLESSSNLPIMTLIHHAFELRRVLSHPLVVISNVTQPILTLGRFSSQLIWILFLILYRQSLESSANLPIMTLTHHAFEIRHG